MRTEAVTIVRCCTPVFLLSSNLLEHGRNIQAQHSTLRIWCTTPHIFPYGHNCTEKPIQLKANIAEIVLHYLFRKVAIINYSRKRTHINI